MAENQSLKAQRAILTRHADQLRQNNQHHSQIIDQPERENIELEELNSIISYLSSETTILKEDTNQLKEDTKRLKDDTIFLRFQLEDLKVRVVNQDDKISSLQKRTDAITMRDGMFALEQYIMLDIIGSKKKMRRIHGFDYLSNSEDYKDKYQTYLANHDLSQDHIDLLISLNKDRAYSHS